MAISLISPGIKITEQDLVSSSPTVASTTGSIAGQFNWGPINEPTVVVSEADLVAQFGKPNATNIVDFLSAANFLGYSQPLYVVRAANTTAASGAAGKATNATANGTGQLIENQDQYILNPPSNLGTFVARYAGELGNSIKTSVCASSNAWSNTLTGTFTVAAGATLVVGAGSAANTELVAGDYIILGDRTIKVASITNTTHFTLETAHLTGASGVTGTRRWEFYGEFSAAPGTSSYASSRGGANDEMHIIVVDEDGAITGVADTILEKWEAVSKANDAKGENGGSNYYKDVVNDRSQWIYWGEHPSTGYNWGTTVVNKTFSPLLTGAKGLPENKSLAGGSDGSAITAGERSSAYLLLNNEAEVPPSIIIGGQSNATTINRIIADVCEARRDTIVTISPGRSDVVNNAGDEADDILTWSDTITRSTFVVADSGWKYQYDKYNDTYVYIPLNADIAGCMSRNDTNREPWLSPAGAINGRIQNLIRLAYNPNQADRDALYKASINPVITQIGRGTILYGDKTFTLKNSSLNRINVRRLFIELQNTIGAAAENVLFEQNDAATRNSFVNLIVPYLRSVQARRGITAFRVVCDTSNNPPSVVNNNEFVCDIFVQPARTVNFIQLNFISVRGSATFTEVAA